MNENDKTPDTGDERTGALSRRGFLSTVAAGGALASGAAVIGSPAAGAQSFDPERAPAGRGGYARRANEAFRRRRDAAAADLRGQPGPAPSTNGDEQRYGDLRAAFFKTLPQNEYGEVDPDAYRAMRRALTRGSFEAMENVPLSPLADRRLANPLAAWAFEMIGPDAWAPRMAPAPAFASQVQAAEMGEVYWQALTRDVPFTDYASDPAIAAASADLNAFSHRLGGGDPITPATLFRGETPGDLVGPYLSQFLWLPANWGVARLDQRFALPLAGQDFGLARAEWLNLQRGAAPLAATVFGSAPRHIANGRDLAEYVHGDVVYQAYLTAALIMLGMGSAALDPQNPYLDAVAQGPFVTFGTAEVVDLVAKAANAALKVAWFQKWLVHRRLRPEVLAARAEFQYTGERAYDLDRELLDSAAASELLARNGNLLLPLAYPEGSPTHPAYPAGHAVVAGACTTVLKALFDEHYAIPDPVEASADGFSLHAWTGAPLTLGGELNKLASNIALGRDTAGVHYRSDGIDGVVLGEAVALGILADYAGTHAERFAGFELTRFDGSTAHVGGDGVTPRRRRPQVSRRRYRFNREY